MPGGGHLVGERGEGRPRDEKSARERGDPPVGWRERRLVDPPAVRGRHGDRGEYLAATGVVGKSREVATIATVVRTLIRFPSVFLI